MSDAARERTKFLEDIIAELSRQRLEDDQAFQGLKRLPPVEVFKKLCFDYPLVDDNDIQCLACAMQSFLGMPTAVADPSFPEAFFLHEKFLGNILGMCNATGSSTNQSSPHQVAATVFLAAPKYLLGTTLANASRMLTGAREPQALSATVTEVCSIIQLSTVSSLSSEVHQSQSSSVLALLQNSNQIDALCDVVRDLGTWVVESELVVGDAEQAGGTVGAALQTLDDRNFLGSSNKATSLLSVLHLVRERASTAAANPQAGALLQAALAVVKPAWLHATMFLRDLLVHYPQLVPAKATQLLSALAAGNGGVAPAPQHRFPSSMECAYVLVLTTLCAHCEHSITNSANPSQSNTVAQTVARLQAKAALRSYLDAGANLSTAVDICTRMAADSSGTHGSSSGNAVNVDVLGYLIDISAVYCCDPERPAVTAARSGAASSGGAVSHPLIASRLLPTLLFNMISLLKQQHQQLLPQAQSESAARASPVTVAVTDRLIRSLSLLVLPGSTPSTAVLRYVLEFPDLLDSVAQLPLTWHARGAAGGSAVALVTEAHAMALAGSLLLSALHTQVTPGGSPVALQAEAQFALLTTLTKATEGVSGTLSALRDSLAAERQHQASSRVPRDSPIDRDDNRIEAAPVPTTSTADTEAAHEAGGETPDAPLEEADSAAKLQKKRAAQQVQVTMQHLQALCASLAVLAGEGACAAPLRAVCAAVYWRQQNSTTTLCAVVQTILSTFCGQALPVVAEALALCSGLTSEGSDTTDSSAPKGRVGAGSLSTAASLELARKRLKALQSLLSGAASSKAD